MQPPRIGQNRCRPNVPREREVGHLELPRKGIGSCGCNVGQVTRVPGQLDGCGVGSGEHLQVVHHPGQAKHLVAQ